VINVQVLLIWFLVGVQINVIDVEEDRDWFVDITCICADNVLENWLEI